MADLPSNQFGELQFRSLVQSLPSAITVADLEERQVLVNPAFCALVGWTEEELLGRTAPFVYWPAEDAAQTLDSLRQFYSNPLPDGECVRRYCRKNGERFLVRMRRALLLGDGGASVGTMAVVDDLDRIAAIDSRLQQREQFFESIVRGVPGFIYIFDLRTHTSIYTNRVMPEALGYTPEYIRSMGSDFLRRLLHPDDVARAPEWFARWNTAKDNQVLETTYRILSAWGEYRWYLSRDAVFRRDESGKPIQLIGAAQDITARKKAEEAQLGAEKHLRESERRYRLLADHATDMICRLDPQGKFLDVSPACARMTGFNPNELVGRNEYELVHPADRDLAFDFHRKIIIEKSPQTLTYRIRAKEGNCVWFETHAQPILDPVTNDVVELLAVSRDVTDRRKTEDALRRSEELFRTLVERSRDGIALLEAHGRVRYLSPAASDILGYTAAELSGIDARTLILAEDYQSVRKASSEALGAPGGHLSTQFRIKNRHGSIRHLEAVVVNHLNDPYIGAYTANFRDVTDRIELEDQLRQAQKMEAIGQLAGGIAHDFNNILTAIIGNVSIILDAAAPNDPWRSTLSAIEQAAHRAAELTSRLLGYSRRTTLHLRPTDLNSVAAEALKLLRPTIDPRIVFDLRLDPGLWPAAADSDQFSQVLTNLCLNSRDAMPRGGRLTVHSANCVIDHEYIKTHVTARRGEYVRVTVEDTGSGIASDIRGRIFEPFFTTKDTGKGTGLGLAMVYGILNSHGGWVTCDTEVGAGTRMALFLPRCAEPAEGPKTASRSKTVAPHLAQGQTVLLVDDEPGIRTLGRFVLEQQGYRVLLAEDGVEAVETFRIFADQVALVILDLTMPNMSGQDAFRHLRRIAPDVRVLFSSGYSSDQLGNLDSGVAFINKPYRPDELVEAVRSHIGSDQRNGRI